MRHQAGKTIKPLSTKPAGAIDRVESHDREITRVANVMQTRGRDEHVAISARHSDRDLPSSFGGASEMLPAHPTAAETLSLRDRPGDDVHQTTVTRSHPARSPFVSQRLRSRCPAIE